MKLQKMLLMALFLVLGLSACTTNNTDLDDITDPTEKRYKVRLACAGELDVTQQPLRGITLSDNDLYAVKVSYEPVSASSNSKPYAYGLFDDISKAEIELLDGYEYYVSVYLIVDGKNVIYSDSTFIDDNLYRCFAEPFKTSDSEFGVLNNAFTYSEETSFDSFHNGVRLCNDSRASYWVENVESYYGGKSFVPTADGEVLTINMERMTYGLKFIANDFLTKGEVVIKCEYESQRGHWKFYSLSPESRTIEVKNLYYSPSFWYGQTNLLDAKADVLIDITWKKDDTTEIALKRKEIQINRLKQTVVRINMTEDKVLGNGSLSLSFEDYDITESDTNQYTFGENQNEYKW
ncbi:MAG: hypothetical protein IKM03_03400 [Alistipes sp.]|nr:hypothetical protein [Alistipes sp.]